MNPDASATARQLGLNLQQFRIESGLNRPQIAAKIGKTADTIRKLEFAYVGYSDETVEALAKAFDRSVAELFSEKPTPSKGRAVAPAFALKVMAKDVPRALRQRADAAIDELNEAYAKVIRKLQAD